MRIPSLLAAGVAALGLLAGSLAAPAPAAEAAPRARWLLVADPTARAVSVADASTGRTTGALPGAVLGTHAA
ncbi:hypothetical protein BC477_19490 [Clavibacter michiganensis subsp. michiganensis]|uniref:Uncharacterized protein n=1 Tax=Clavibacter michiganensis subsp. michiganensis TaxID=33013 RepID=A0A251XGK1_CLAMM|nr:hypothetical protein BC477_19490 [Clavibacter michiganensis subsp. michiganensis]OUE01668.1 hypothetical protein CMMCAS07_15275 [Clavibacter michiganensis subsp. michiganensis]